MKNKNTKGGYTDRSKSIGNKVGFAAAFTNITRRRTLPKDVSIHTAEMTAIKISLKEIQI